MEFEICGWPGDGITLDLDHERFAYAGKFVMSRTGKAVVRDGGTLVGAVAFDADRTDESVCRLRYVTIRADRRGEGIGSELLAFVRSSVVADGKYDAARIAVNNPYAYDAAYRAGFGYTGEETGIAELVLAWPRPTRDGDVPAGSSSTGEVTTGDQDPFGSSAEAAAYRAGLARFGERSLSDPVREFVEGAVARGPPEVTEGPRG